MKTWYFTEMKCTLSSTKLHTTIRAVLLVTPVSVSLLLSHVHAHCLCGYMAKKI